MDDKQLQQEFIQFLGEQLQAKDQKDLEKKIQKLGQDGLKKYYDTFVEHKKKKAQKAAHGAKLNYFRRLKNICAEDEELQYFKRGGQVDCGCVKKAQQGTKAPKNTEAQKKSSLITRFKEDFKKKKEDLERKVYGRTKAEQKEIDRLSEKDYLNGTADHKVKKNCGGGFMKKAKITISAKGTKVCPKCGKVHTGVCK